MRRRRERIELEIKIKIEHDRYWREEGKKI